MWTKENALELQNALSAEFVKVYYTDLGGASRASLMITIGFDKRETWKNNIFENSRYAKFSLHYDQKIECLVRDSKLTKFRKVSAPTVQIAAQKLQKWIDENK